MPASILVFLTLFPPNTDFGVITKEAFYLCALSIPNFLEITCVFSSLSPPPHPDIHSLKTEYRKGNSAEEIKISLEYHLLELAEETTACVTQDPDLMTHSLKQAGFPPCLGIA